MMVNKGNYLELEKPTCCLKLILSSGDFLVKLEMKDRGNTKAALPRTTRPSSMALTPTDVPGLHNSSKEEKDLSSTKATYKEPKEDLNPGEIPAKVRILVLESKVYTCE